MSRTAALVTVLAAGATAALAQPARTLSADLAALGAKRRVELEKIAPEAPDPVYLPVVGACPRPDERRIAALQAQVERWVDGRAAGARRIEGASTSFVVGCKDARGVIVDVQIDLAGGGARGKRVGHWWTLRVGDGAVEIVAEATGTALVDFQAAAPIRTSSTLAIADVVGDEAPETLIAVDDHPGGAPSSTTISIVTADGRFDVGHHAEAVDLARLQPAASDHTVVVRLDGPRPFYRCIVGTGPWRACPAGDAAERHDLAWAAAFELMMGTTGGYDADLVERKLRALGIPEAERAPFVARAPVTPPAKLAARVADDEARARQALTPDEAKDERVRAEADMAAALAAITGDAPCAEATAAQRKTAAAALGKWLAKGERARLKALDRCPTAAACAKPRPTAPVLQATCVGARGAYWLARWQHGGALAIRREALFYAATRGAPRLVVDTAAALDADDGSAPGHDGAIAAKFAIADGALTALVEVDGMVSAVVDGAPRGSPAAGELAWTFDSQHLTIAMRADSLARTVDTERSDTIVYVRATADGLTPVTRLLPPTLYDPPSAIDPVGRLLEPHERMRRARELAAGLEPARLSNPTYRANVIGALRLLGADPTVVARFGPP